MAPQEVPPQRLLRAVMRFKTGLGLAETADFDTLRSVGMAVRLLAIHIRGLPPVNYSTLRLVALNYLNIPSTGLQQILEILAEVEFVKFQTEGRSIKTVVPTFPL